MGEGGGLPAEGRNYDLCSVPCALGDSELWAGGNGDRYVYELWSHGRTGGGAADEAGRALIAGLAAKEVVVSSMSVLFGITNVTSAAGMAGMRTALAGIGFTAVNAYALMTFCLLYTPCMAAVATIRRETNSWRWTVFGAVFQSVLAWIVATAVYRIGVLL